MQKPTIHRNGSSKEHLSEPLLEACDLIAQAIRRLEHDGAPNARDYYMQESDAFKVAMREHVGRLVKLQAVRAELVELIEHITDS